MSATAFVAQAGSGGLRHEAVLYSGHDQFISLTSQFIRQAFAAGEPVLVMVSAAKIAALKAVLAGETGAIHYADMTSIGRNPGQIMPAWQEFADRYAHTGRPLRGIGEPIWTDRTDAHIAELHINEILTDVAFADRRDLWVLCLYDIAVVGQAIIDQALCNHSNVVVDGALTTSPTYRFAGDVPTMLNPPLPVPPAGATSLDFTTAGAVDAVVDRCLGTAGFSGRQRSDFVKAAHTLAADSVTHGDGHGSLVVWVDGDRAICDISDDGHIAGALAGRQRPAAGAGRGNGLWEANQLCDLVQMRTSADGSTVRLHVGHDHTAVEQQRHDDLDEFGTRWAEVWQAAGMVSGQLVVDVDHALTSLRAVAYTSGQHIGDLATDVVSGKRRFADSAPR
ncbi:MAG: putative serine/threonine kinase anti-sigma factor [Ilumatobacteraceae bacterium]|nr:putative serine/threonine kinase anti-sigma factor [Ilumatobacteraceae bacterium]